MATQKNTPGYVESKDFVPNPTDMTGTLNTTRTGIPNNADAANPVFAQDRRAAAARVKDALDGKGDTSVVYSSTDISRDEESKALKARAEAVLAQPEVVPGSPTKAQQEAAEKGAGDPAASTSGSEQPDITDVNQSNTSAQGIAEQGAPEVKTTTARKATAAAKK